MHRTVLQYLEDNLEAIRNIKENSSDISFDNLLLTGNEKTRVIRNFEIIGKATKKLPDDL